MMKNFNADAQGPSGSGCGLSEDRKRLRTVLLDLLVEFDRVCKQNEIRYFLDSGTLLGAVRHKGFIPWDDDIDVILLREEYERLCEIGPKAFSAPYFFQTNKTDPGSARRHAQLRNSETTGILESEMRFGRPMFRFNQGVFLDVLVLDDVPDDAEELEAFRRELWGLCRKMANAKGCLGADRLVPWSALSPANTRMKLHALLLKCGNVFFGKSIVDSACEELERRVQRYNGTGQSRCANFALNPRRPDSQLFDKRIYSETAEYDFEGLKFPGPKDYNAVLTGHYGDWRTPVVGASSHGGVFVDVDNPYTKYVVGG